MSKRVRWLIASPLSRASLARIAEGLHRDEYEANATTGFISSIVRTTFVEARYIERFERAESIIDPFGQPQEFQRIEYQQTAFRLSVDAPQLEIYDGPRSIGPLLNRLGSFTDTVIQPLNVDVVKWLRQLQTEISETCVTAAHIARLSLSEKVSAKIVVNGTEDVRSFVKSVVGNKPFRFERLEVAAKFKGETIRFDLREEGRATISSGSDEFVSILRGALTASL